MIDESFGPILNDIGQHMAEILDGNIEDSFMYAEAKNAWQAVSIFGFINGQLTYHSPTHELVEAVGELWETAATDKKWAAISYSIHSGAFSAEFEFPEDLDPEEHHIDRRERILEARYPGLNVEYPPFDQE